MHTSGRGSGRSALELQLIWLEKVCAFAEEQGRIPIFWDDMPIKHAELYRPMFNISFSREEIDSLWAKNEHKLIQFLDRFPKNCIYMRWNYSHPQAEGNIKAMEWFTDHDLQVMGATAGQTRWVLMPQQESNMENIRSFALTSIEKGLDGLLLTLWDDDSPHFELYKRGIFAFSEYSWSGERQSKEEIKSAYRHRTFSSSVAGDGFAFIDELEGPVAFWNNALLEGADRRNLRKMEDPVEQAVIPMPDPEAAGAWSSTHSKRLEVASRHHETCNRISAVLDQVQPLAVRNSYRLDIYRQVNRLAGFTPEILIRLQTYDQADSEEGRSAALEQLRVVPSEFRKIREEMERVYGQTRILEKPEGYILDQDHHNHLANQALDFSWLFSAELIFLEKLEQWLLNVE